MGIKGGGAHGTLSYRAPQRDSRGVPPNGIQVECLQLDPGKVPPSNEIQEECPDAWIQVECPQLDPGVVPPNGIQVESSQLYP